MGLENTNTIAIRANQTPSSLPQLGHTRGANTFPLRNQSLALESLKDQFGFLVTKILDGDSKEPNQQNKTKKSPSNAARIFLTCDRMATPLGTLGLSLVIVFFIMLCVVVFLFYYEWFTLFKSFSMHLYISIIHDVVIHHFIIFFLESAHIKFKLSGGLAACLIT